MAKKKLIRFHELEGFENVIQPELKEVLNTDYKLKGNWNTFFKNQNPIVLELACGKGEYSLGLGAKYPNKNFLGIDIKGARTWYGATAAKEKGLSNVAFLRTRIDFIESFFGEEEVEAIWIIHPDPQPQSNRARKRLTSPMFIDRYRKFLKKGGLIHLRTDSDFFFEYTLSEIKSQHYQQHRLIEDVYQDDLFTKGEEELKEVLRTKTHYEEIFMAKGHSIKYVSFSI